MSTVAEKGTCPECFGYTSCQNICPIDNEEYNIPCVTDTSTPLGRKFFRMIELFSGARLLPGIDAHNVLENSSGWALLAHANNAPGPTNIRYNTNSPPIPINVADAQITVVALELESGSTNKYKENIGTEVSYGSPCTFIFKVGVDYYRLGVDANFLQGVLIAIETWPEVPLTGILDHFTLHPGDDENWQTNTEVAVFGKPFFIQVGIPFLSTISILSFSFGCTEDENYKKLTYVYYNVLTLKLSGVFRGLSVKSYTGLYPIDESADPKVTSVATTQTCDIESYSIWFIAQPVSDELCSIPGTSGSTSGGSIEDAKTWLWILLGVIGGIIIIGLLYLGFKSIKGSDDDEQNVTEIIIPRQSLPPPNVPQTYPTVATYANGGSPYIVSSQPIPYPGLANPSPNPMTTSPHPAELQQIVSESAPKPPLPLNASVMSGGVVL